MFTNKQILDFCNLQMERFRDQYEHISSEGKVIMDIPRLSQEFIFQHALENSNQHQEIYEAVKNWWNESTYNELNGKFKI